MKITPKYAYFEPKKFFENFLFTWKVIYFLTKMRESAREMIKVTFPTNLQEKIIFSTKRHLKKWQKSTKLRKIDNFSTFLNIVLLKKLFFLAGLLEKLLQSFLWQILSFLSINKLLFKQIKINKKKLARNRHIWALFSIFAIIIIFAN